MLDWSPGTRAVSRLVQIVIDDNGKVRHCGMGYQIQSPSGRVLGSSGHTWGGPDAEPPQPYLARLQELMDIFVAEVDGTEGFNVNAQ